MCSRPPRSPTIVGIAVPTTMLSNIDSSIASMTPNSTQRTFLGVRAGLAERAAEDAGDVDMANHSLREVVKETWEGRRPAGAPATPHHRTTTTLRVQQLYFSM